MALAEIDSWDVEPVDTEQLAGGLNAAEAAVVDHIARVVVDESWQGAGISSINHWIRWCFGVTNSRASQYLKIAERSGELPTVMTLFREGRLSVEQVRLIAIWCPTQYETSVAEFALYASVPQLRRTLRQYPFPTPDEDENDGPSARRRAVLVHNHDGTVSFHVRADTNTGERIKTALTQYQTKLAAHTASDGGYPTLFDAFEAIIDTAAQVDPSTCRRNRNRTLLHVDVETLKHEPSSGVDGFNAWFHLGSHVDRDLFELVSCEGTIQTLITRFGKPLRLGRTRRVVPSWLRDVITDRDWGCRVCGSSRNLDVHHLTHWSKGGLTDPDNLVTLCSTHHRLLHEGEIIVEGNPNTGPHVDHLTVVNRYGVTLHRPPKPPDDQTQGLYETRMCERFDRSLVHFHPTKHPPPNKPPQT